MQRNPKGCRMRTPKGEVRHGKFVVLVQNSILESKRIPLDLDPLDLGSRSSLLLSNLLNSY